jgi:predicted 3-demethylubiquinone-9 3-methyltransferase (glyoxalase superfamily)
MQKIAPFLWFDTQAEEAANPTILGEMLSDPDPKKSKRVMEAMLKMRKIDIAGLKRAYEGLVK